MCRCSRGCNNVWYALLVIKFYVNLQNTIGRILRNDILVMLGDFNARVGMLDTGKFYGKVLQGSMLSNEGDI